jgi:hypothetical protein
MKKQKKGRFPPLPFQEALERLIQTDPKEMADTFKKNQERAEEIQRSAKERRERLRRAIQDPEN